MLKLQIILNHVGSCFVLTDNIINKIHHENIYTLVDPSVYMLAARNRCNYSLPDSVDSAVTIQIDRGYI